MTSGTLNRTHSLTRSVTTSHVTCKADRHSSFDYCGCTTEFRARFSDELPAAHVADCSDVTFTQTLARCVYVTERSVAK